MRAASWTPHECVAGHVTSCSTHVWKWKCSCNRILPVLTVVIRAFNLTMHLQYIYHNCTNEAVVEIFAWVEVVAGTVEGHASGRSATKCQNSRDLVTAVLQPSGTKMLPLTHLKLTHGWSKCDQMTAAKRCASGGGPEAAQISGMGKNPGSGTPSMACSPRLATCLLASGCQAELALPKGHADAHGQTAPPS